MRQWTRNVSFLLLVGSSLGILGILGTDLYRLVSFLSFFVFVWTFFPSRWSVGRTRFYDAGVGALIFALALFVGRFADLGLFHFYFFVSIAILVALRRSESPELAELASYAVGLACIGILAELVRITPNLWHLEMRTAAVLSSIGGFIARADRNLGPTAMGLPLLISLLVLALVRQALAERRHRYRWLIIACALTVTHIVYLVILDLYARWLARRPGLDWLLLNSQHLFIVLSATVFTALDRGGAIRRVTRPVLLRSIPAAAACFAMGAVIILFFGWARPPAHRPARVLLYDAGYMNWQVPVHGKYGERSAGMFGMLPSALQALGFEPVISNDLGLLDNEDPPDCVVMINIQRYFDDEQRERIWKYIAEGGGLLCLGDHTGVAGIRGPFNDLLRPVGIRFEFDSSTFFGRGWNDALALRPHPLNCGVTNAEDYQLWVGATLGIDPPAVPVVVGRYGYSDIGDPANIQRSYLGDRRYNPDELLGDIVLVADGRYGRGRVLVFGDTSGYQNLSLARSLDSVARSLDYLASKGSFGVGTPWQILIVLAALLVLGGAVAHARSPLPIATAAAGFAIGAAALQAATPAPPRAFPVFPDNHAQPLLLQTANPGWDVAVIDASHGGHFTLHAWKNNSIGGLQLNLARNGYFPLIRDEFPYGDLETGARILVLVAPTQRYSQKEIDAVENFVAGGGRVIASVGFEELDGSEALLNRFGLSVANVPLGRFEVEVPSDSLSVLVHEGWPVEFDDRGASRVLLSNWGLPVAVVKNYGNGEFVLIGDSSFFHDVNLETLDHYFAGNVAFLKRLTGKGLTQ